MGWEISEVQNKRDLKCFVKFPLQLYRNHPYYVPPLITDEISIFSPIKIQPTKIVKPNYFWLITIIHVLGVSPVLSVILPIKSIKKTFALMV